MRGSIEEVHVEDGDRLTSSLRDELQRHSEPIVNDKWLNIKFPEKFRADGNVIPPRSRASWIEPEGKRGEIILVSLASTLASCPMMTSKRLA